MNKKIQLIDVLSHMVKENTCKLLLDSAKPIVEMYNHKESLTKSLAIFKENEPIEEINQLVFNNNYYSVLHDEQFMKKIDNMNSISIIGSDKEPNLLKDIIDQIENTVKTTTNRKNNIFMRAFFNIESAKSYLYDYIHVTIKTGSKNNYTFKATQFSINLGESLLNFFLMQVPLLRNLMACFDSDNLLSEKTILSIDNFIAILFSNNKDLIKKTFIDLGISDDLIQEYVSYYLKNQLYLHVHQNTIYQDTLKNNIMPYLKNIDRISIINLLNTFYVNMGYSMVSLFCLKGGFFMDLEKVNTDLFDSPVKPNNIKIINLSSALLKNIVSQSNTKIPILRTEQLNKSSAGLIHTNPRINLKLKDNNYLHKKKLITKLSVDTDYLAIFLNKIYTSSLDVSEICSLYDIDYIKIQHLEALGSFIPFLLTAIFQMGADFNYLDTPQALKKKIIKDINQKIKDGVILENSLDLEIYEQHKEIIFSLIDKMFQRKILLIDTLTASIRYSIYKYVILATYLDTRLRKYLNGLVLNINNNPYAKWFVRPYNENYNQHGLDSDDLKMIRDCLKFEQTKAKISLSTVKNDSNNKRIVYTYIKNYLSIDLEQLTLWIEDPLYYNNAEGLLTEIKKYIKKNKNLFYVQSLIYFEQLQHQKLNVKHLFNYARMDVSSSGTQMMSILFKNKELGILSNLIGNKNYDFYDKAREYNYKTYMEIHAFVKEQLPLFSSSILLNKAANLKLSAYTQNEFHEILKFTDNIMALFSMFFSVNIMKSSILPNLLEKLIISIKDKNIITKHPLISCLISYLPMSIKVIMKRLCSLDIFSNKIQDVEYLFALRYASRLINAVEHHIGISHLPEDKDSIWFSRDLTKNHVMTLMYMSTAYGRKEAYNILLQDKYLLGTDKKHLLQELNNFLESTTSTFISKKADFGLLKAFVNDVCHHGNKIIINNKHFMITLDPKEYTDIQVPCSSYEKKRGPQLIIKKYDNKTDKKKLCAMFMANLAHSMDSSIVHYFSQICLQINKRLVKNYSDFKLIFETNHDCFFLNYPVLLPILIEEAYLMLIEENYIENIQGLSQELINKYSGMSTEEYLKALNPINPNYLK